MSVETEPATGLRAVVRRFRWVLFAPVLAAVALGGWAVASPIGGSPDDDFHMVSIWCADVITPHCSEGDAVGERRVPEALVRAGCYNRLPDESAACQQWAITLDASVTVSTSRGNFNGGYPPVFYAAMGLFATSDISTSIVVMRVVNVLIFLGVSTALYLLLPLARRPALLWGWLVATVPLGVYIIPSVNPSSWSVVGVATAWLALLGWFESRGARKVGLGIVFAIGVLLAAGSRSDAAVYVALGVAVVGVLTITRSRRWWLDAILPAVALVGCAVSVLSTNMLTSAANGFGPGAVVSPGDLAVEDAPSLNVIALLAFNLLNVPSLWAGALGTWGLGWFDVDLPFVVSYASIACFVGVGFTGLRSMNVRKALALAGIGLSLIVLPVYVLTRGGAFVGVEVQPRYLLPLIVLLAGLLVIQVGARGVDLSRGQLILVLGSLSVAHFVSLHTTIRRYVTGVDEPGFSLDAGIEWWWSSVPSPNVVVIVASLAYVGAVILLGSSANALARDRAAEVRVPG